MSGKITPIYHYRYISQILLFFDSIVTLPFSIFLGYCLQQKEATFVYVPAYTQLVTVIAVVFFLRPNPLYHSLVPVAVSLLRETYGGMSRGQVRIETSWPVSKSLSRFWTCVPRPKVNVSALFDDRASVKKKKKAANFYIANYNHLYLTRNQGDERVEHRIWMKNNLYISFKKHRI